MKRKVVDCDKCQKECKNGHIHLDIPNGVEHEFGGHSTEAYFNFEKKDICLECAQTLLKFMLNCERIYPDSGGIIWKPITKHHHPKSKTNDAIGMALKFFSVKEKG